jgi:hypothetical protein
MNTAEKFDCWAIVEVMGHQRYAGKVTEQSIGGCNFVRVDVPAIPAETKGEGVDRVVIKEGQAEFTKLLGQASIFAITPVAEEVARHVAARIMAAPVHVYELPTSPQKSIAFVDGDFEDSDYDADDEAPL